MPLLAAARRRLLLPPAAHPLAALGEPAIALLASAPPAANGAAVAADAIVALGARGAMLVLRATAAGSLRRELWRAPDGELLGGCVLATLALLWFVLRFMRRGD